LLDSQGRAVGVVPINIWDDTLEHPARPGPIESASPTPP
jgi:hypothetical protein